MNAAALKKAWLSAAIAAGGIIMAIVFYAFAAEALRMMGYKPPLTPPAAYFLKYAFYLIGLSAIAVLKIVAAKLEVKKASPEETVKALTIMAIVRAAVCEVPAISGFLLFILTGYTLDFCLLLVFSIGLEIYYFPKLSQWEERIRGDFGQL